MIYCLRGACFGYILLRKSASNACFFLNCATPVACCKAIRWFTSIRQNERAVGLPLRTRCSGIARLSQFYLKPSNFVAVSFGEPDSIIGSPCDDERPPGGFRQR